MKVNDRDVAVIGATLVSLRDDAIDKLDNVFEYLNDRTDFSNRQLHIGIAADVGSVLQGFAELQMWADWGVTLSAVIAEKGEAATMEEIATALSAALIGRARNINLSLNGAGPTAAAYALHVMEQYAKAAETCIFLVAAERATLDVCNVVAPTFGTTGEDLLARMKAGDELVLKAVMKCALERAIERAKTNGKPLPPLPDALAAALKSDSGATANDAHDLIERFTLDESVKVPAFPPHFNGGEKDYHADSIKVG